MQHRDQLADRINCQPQPQRVSTTPQPSAQFVELHMRQVEALEVVVVQRRAVHAGPGQPGGNGGMAVAEHPHGRSNIQSFRQRRQHFCDAC